MPAVTVRRNRRAGAFADAAPQVGHDKQREGEHARDEQRKAQNYSACFRQLILPASRRPAAHPGIPANINTAATRSTAPFFAPEPRSTRFASALDNRSFPHTHRKRESRAQFVREFARQNRPFAFAPRERERIPTTMRATSYSRTIFSMCSASSPPARSNVANPLRGDAERIADRKTGPSLARVDGEEYVRSWLLAAASARHSVRSSWFSPSRTRRTSSITRRQRSRAEDARPIQQAAAGAPHRSSLPRAIRSRDAVGETDQRASPREVDVVLVIVEFRDASQHHAALFEAARRAARYHERKFVARVGVRTVPSTVSTTP
jgi:hypothetical protein